MQFRWEDRSDKDIFYKRQNFVLISQYEFYYTCVYNNNKNITISIVITYNSIKQQ